MSLDLSLGPLPLEMDKTGTVRVGGTRVTLDTLIAVFNQGEAPEQIQYEFPGIGLADVYLTIGYYLRRKREVDAYLKQRDLEAEALRGEIEAHQDTQGLRERMQALREKQAQAK